MAMGQDFFKDLPSKIINNIVLRFPLRTIAISKCVCISWFDFLEKDEFVKSHLSRSSAALAVLQPGNNSTRFTLYELEDDVESSHDHRYNRLTELDFPCKVSVLGSANGLLFLKKYRDALESNFDLLYVWSPLCRVYIELNCPREFRNLEKKVTYGFGVSKISGQYKVVRNIDKSDCHVYTLGTRSWRRVEAAGVSFDCGYYKHGVFLFGCGYYNHGVFLIGNLHWLVFDSDDSSWISCFDLETECFSTFPTSPVHQGLDCMKSKLCALRDCLCLCGNTFESDGVIDIWLMKDYGVGKSWTKEYVINFNLDFDTIALGSSVAPIKVFKDGHILMQLDGEQLFYYSNKAKTTQEFGRGLFEFHPYNYSMLLTPSFLSLKSFGMENVISF